MRADLPEAVVDGRSWKRRRYGLLHRYAGEEAGGSSLPSHVGLKREGPGATREGKADGQSAIGVADSDAALALTSRRISDPVSHDPAEVVSEHVADGSALTQGWRVGADLA